MATQNLSEIAVLIELRMNDEDMAKVFKYSVERVTEIDDTLKKINKQRGR